MKGNHNGFESVIRLGWKGLFHVNDKTLYCGHNAGFFSNCSVTLWNIAELYRGHKLLPERIDFSKAFRFYKDPVDQTEEVDLYPVLFQSSPSCPVALRKHIEDIDHHGIYKLIDFPSYSSLMGKYFNLSEKALEVQNTLINKYDIDFSKTISVIYRGTDKGNEIKLADPELYLNKAKELLLGNPSHRVLIQTDDINVRNLFVNALGDQCFYLQEMPVTSKNHAIHNLDAEILQMPRVQFGVLLLAVTHLLSKSHYIVNHTGNMALWVCLFRGNSTNMFQVDKSGRLVTFQMLIFPWLLMKTKQIAKSLFYK